MATPNINRPHASPNRPVASPIITGDAGLDAVLSGLDPAADLGVDVLLEGALDFNFSEEVQETETPAGPGKPSEAEEIQTQEESGDKEPDAGKGPAEAGSTEQGVGRVPEGHSLLLQWGCIPVVVPNGSLSESAARGEASQDLLDFGSGINDHGNGNVPSSPGPLPGHLEEDTQAVEQEQPSRSYGAPSSLLDEHLLQEMTSEDYDVFFGHDNEPLPQCVESPPADLRSDDNPAYINTAQPSTPERPASVQEQDQPSTRKRRRDSEETTASRSSRGDGEEEEEPPTKKTKVASPRSTSPSAAASGPTADPAPADPGSTNHHINTPEPVVQPSPPERQSSAPAQEQSPTGKRRRDGEEGEGQKEREEEPPTKKAGVASPRSSSASASASAAASGPTPGAGPSPTPGSAPAPAATDQAEGELADPTAFKFDAPAPGSGAQTPKSSPAGGAGSPPPPPSPSPPTPTPTPPSPSNGQKRKRSVEEDDEEEESSTPTKRARRSGSG